MYLAPQNIPRELYRHLAIKFYCTVLYCIVGVPLRSLLNQTEKGGEGRGEGHQEEER